MLKNSRYIWVAYVEKTFYPFVEHVLVYSLLFTRVLQIEIEKLNYEDGLEESLVQKKYGFVLFLSNIVLLLTYDVYLASITFIYLYYSVREQILRGYKQILLLLFLSYFHIDGNLKLKSLSCARKPSYLRPGTSCDMRRWQGHIWLSQTHKTVFELCDFFVKNFIFFL